MAKIGTKKGAKRLLERRFLDLDKGLRKRTKAELVGLLLELAREHGEVARDLEDRLGIAKSPERLVADVSSALACATDFEEGSGGDLAGVDWDAYSDLKEGLVKLLKRGQRAEAMSLALRLMKDGSYQIECSDEGLMEDEISQCLRPVIRAVEKAGGEESVRWAREMLAADRMGFICRPELEKLSGGASAQGKRPAARR